MHGLGQGLDAQRAGVGVHTKNKSFWAMEFNGQHGLEKLGGLVRINSHCLLSGQTAKPVLSG